LACDVYFCARVGSIVSHAEQQPTWAHQKLIPGDSFGVRVKKQPAMRCRGWGLRLRSQRLPRGQARHADELSLAMGYNVTLGSASVLSEHGRPRTDAHLQNGLTYFQPTGFPCIHSSVVEKRAEERCIATLGLLFPSLCPAVPGFRFIS
jgi:hypothetical protein